MNFLCRQIVLMLAGVVVLLVCGACSKSRPSVNPYDPKGPEISYSTTIGDGHWATSQLSSNVVAPQYQGNAVCGSFLMLQDGLVTSVTQVACVRIDLSAIPKPAFVTNAVLTIQFGCGVSTLFDQLTSPFDATTNYATKPNSIFISQIDTFWSQSGSNYICTPTQKVDITIMVRNWLTNNQPNYGFMMECRQGTGISATDIESIGCSGIGWNMNLEVNYHPE